MPGIAAIGAACVPAATNINPSSASRPAVCAQADPSKVGPAQDMAQISQEGLKQLAAETLGLALVALLMSDPDKKKSTSEIAAALLITAIQAQMLADRALFCETTTVDGQQYVQLNMDAQALAGHASAANMAQMFNGGTQGIVAALG